MNVEDLEDEEAAVEPHAAEEDHQGEDSVLDHQEEEAVREDEVDLQVEVEEAAPAAEAVAEASVPVKRPWSFPMKDLRVFTF